MLYCKIKLKRLIKKTAQYIKLRNDTRLVKNRHLVEIMGIELQIVTGITVTNKI